MSTSERSSSAGKTKRTRAGKTGNNSDPPTVTHTLVLSWKTVISSFIAQGLKYCLSLISMTSCSPCSPKLFLVKRSSGRLNNYSQIKKQPRNLQRPSPAFMLLLLCLKKHQAERNPDRCLKLTHRHGTSNNSSQLKRV